MCVCLLFWFGLLLPGYVVLRLVSPDDLKSGLLGTIGLSYLAVFALLSPVSIAGYLFHLPVAVLSGACVLAVGAALVYITHRGWWRDISRLVITGLGVELLIVVTDLVMSARVGGFMRGDSKVHVARIRDLLEHGLNSLDPYVAGEHFFSYYHTNILHALHAACVQLTRVDIFDEWFISLVWAKLVVASGCYFMGWALFDRRWAAGLTMVFVLAQQAPVTFLVYPNKIAPLWLLPIMVGFAVEVFRSPLGWKTPLKLAAGSLVLGQVHALYAVFAGIALAPFLVVLFVIRLLRRKPDRWRLAACILALGVAAPFSLVGKAKMAKDYLPSPSRVTEDKRFHHYENGWSVVKPRQMIRYELLAVGILCAMVGARRKQAAILVTGAGAAAIILFVPPICTAAIKAAGLPHTVYRLHTLITLAFYGLIPGASAFLLEPVLRSRWLRVMGFIAIFLLGAQFAPSEKKYSWSFYYESALASRKVRHQWLTRLRDIRTFFQEHIPRGTTVLTDDKTAMWLVMTHDCHVVIPERTSTGVADIRQRKADLKTMLAPETPWEVRRGLLTKYDINLFLVGGGGPQAIEWTQGHVKEYWKGSGYLLLSLTTD